MSLNSRIALAIAAAYAGSGDIAPPVSKTDYKRTFILADGVAADQANKIWSDTRTLAASATEDLDLAGALPDAFGSLITFARIKLLAIYAAVANTNDVLVGGASANQFLSPFGDASDVVRVKPGGLFLLVAPGATAYPVTAGTGDKLKVANSAAGTPVDYDIILAGASA